ncbi:MAG: (2Fe-2S)-binding protein [Syntrophorhabdaceae bacterium]|jgi:carbon-monoxide dehydrogenase small subunit|nr:(2Fe-2S)-binding protein [Syntrophorhabdaceae bacterium]MDD5243421.1 (2Fe-2S)-binding protein [Syntrophorhabdaceae bacterium]
MKEKLRDIKFKLNGKEVEIAVNPKTLLLELLREELKLTGTRTGCEVSACGACTVNLDGKAVRSCSILAVQVNGHEVVTIEGVADGEKLHPIQEAMVNHGAIECGFCTSGMVMSARALLLDNPRATREDIKKALQGNMCADSGYVKYVEAIEIAAKVMQGK